MSWFAQLRHVLAKDLRAQRWLLMAYVALLAYSAVGSLSVGRAGDLAEAARLAPSSINYSYEASSDPSTSVTSEDFMIATSMDEGTAISLAPASSSLADFFAPIVAVLLCGLIVLADHPTQPRALWASLPYNHSAVWGAKIAFVLSLITLAAIANSIPLAVLQLAVTEIPALLGESALELLMLCVVALMLASAAADLRMVIFLALLLLLGSFVLGLLVAVRDADWVVPTFVWLLIKPAIILASVGWLYIVYRSRPRARRARAMSIGLAGLMFAPQALQVRAPISEPSATSLEIPEAEISSRLEAQYAAGSDSLTLVWHLRSAGIPSTMRATQLRGRPYVATADRECATTFLNLRVPGFATLRSPPLPLDTGLTWPVGAPRIVDSLSFSHVVWRGRANTQEARCAQRGWPVHLEMSEPVILAELPLQTGARVTKHGQRVVIRDAAFNGSSRVASVVANSVGAGSLCSSDAPSYFLVNRVQREAVLLEDTRQDGAFGARICTRRFILSLADSSGRASSWSALGKQDSAAAESWLRDARLVVVEWRSRAIVSISPTAAEGTP